LLAGIAVRATLAVSAAIDACLGPIDEQITARGSLTHTVAAHARAAAISTDACCAVVTNGTGATAVRFDAVEHRVRAGRRAAHRPAAHLR